VPCVFLLLPHTKLPNWWHSSRAQVWTMRLLRLLFLYSFGRPFFAVFFLVCWKLNTWWRKGLPIEIDRTNPAYVRVTVQSIFFLCLVFISRWLHDKGRLVFRSRSTEPIQRTCARHYTIRVVWSSSLGGCTRHRRVVQSESVALADSDRSPTCTNQSNSFVFVTVKVNMFVLQACINISPEVKVMTALLWLSNR
jgi:hypothetical protein